MLMEFFLSVFVYSLQQRLKFTKNSWNLNKPLIVGSLFEVSWSFHYRTKRSLMHGLHCIASVKICGFLLQNFITTFVYFRRHSNKERQKQEEQIFLSLIARTPPLKFLRDRMLKIVKFKRRNFTTELDIFTFGSLCTSTRKQLNVSCDRAENKGIFQIFGTLHKNKWLSHKTVIYKIALRQFCEL